MHVHPYLSFEGRCEEAVEFYRKAAGAQVQMLMRNKESPEPDVHGPADKVLHATIRIGDSTVSMSDGRASGKAAFQGFSLCLTVASENEAEQRFAALSDGGQVQLPLTKTFFSPKFGMLTDRFGVGWMVYMVQA